MKIGIIQQRNSSDINANRQSLISKIKQLAGMGAQLVVLPELHDSLYFCQVESVDNFDLAVPIPGDVTRQYADARVRYRARDLTVRETRDGAVPQHSGRV